MVDLGKQYRRLKPQIDTAIQECITSTRFIKGPVVESFEKALGSYLNVKKVVSCGNGTDALQIAMMALEFKPGDEIIVPAFTYVAAAEVIGLLGLTPVLVDVESDTFNIALGAIREAITPKTKAIVPVHLFGQSANMEAIMEIAKEHKLYVIEDNAQAIGADYTFKDGTAQKTGTIGHIGCTSFFPSKNLGCFGDGGAIFTNDEELGSKIKMIASHGQPKQYTHDLIGVNSRLDALQAAILIEKLKYLDDFSNRRQKVATYYDELFSSVEEIQTPYRSSSSTHVFHQYTLQIKNGQRDELRAYLKTHNIPSMIYYPIPLHHQTAYKKISHISGSLEVTEELCKNVLSLPIHTEMETEQLDYIVNKVTSFFNA
jgi:dTDP-4-amino-4,6-dideoxygalactose transaminase